MWKMVFFKLWVTENFTTLRDSSGLKSCDDLQSNHNDHIFHL